MSSTLLLENELINLIFNLDIRKKGAIEKASALGTKLQRRIVRTVNTTAHGPQANVRNPITVLDVVCISSLFYFI